MPFRPGQNWKRTEGYILADGRDATDPNGPIAVLARSPTADEVTVNRAALWMRREQGGRIRFRFAPEVSVRIKGQWSYRRLQGVCSTIYVPDVRPTELIVEAVRKLNPVTGRKVHHRRANSVRATTVSLNYDASR